MKLSKEPPKKALPNKGIRKGASEDQLKAIRKKAEEVRDLERIIEDKQAELQELNQRHYTALYRDLPTLMAEAGVDTLGVPAKGNLPAITLDLKPYYSASIAASWPPEKKEQAFKYLISLKAGDLIKTDVVASYARGSLKEAKALQAQLSKKKNVSVNLKETVHSSTLTAWLKDQVENRNFTPNLELIGGSVGHVVKIKARKD